MAGGEKKNPASHSKEKLSKTDSLRLDDIVQLGGTKVCVFISFILVHISNGSPSTCRFGAWALTE